MPQKLFIEVDDDTMFRLQRAAAKELRSPKQHAAWLLRDLLAHDPSAEMPVVTREHAERLLARERDGL